MSSGALRGGKPCLSNHVWRHSPADSPDPICWTLFRHEFFCGKFTGAIRAYYLLCALLGLLLMAMRCHSHYRECPDKFQKRAPSGKTQKQGFCNLAGGRVKRKGWRGVGEGLERGWARVGEGLAFCASKAPFEKNI